jgi:hypothetical protein
LLVVDCPSAYNAIIDRPTLNALGVIVSTIHMAIRFPGERGTIIMIRGKGSEARHCYLESLKIVKSPHAAHEDPETKGRRKMERRDVPKDGGVVMTNSDLELILNINYLNLREIKFLFKFAKRKIKL